MDPRLPPVDVRLRLRRARLALGLSLQDVAKRMRRPVTRAALSKYELGELTPSASVLVDLGRALGVNAGSLMTGPDDESAHVEWLAYRKHSRLPAREQARLRARAEQVADGYLELLRWLHPRHGARLPFGWAVRDAGEAEAAASRLRKDLELGSGAIERVAEVVEDAGALVVEGVDHHQFDALSGRTRAGLPVIVFNPSRSSDRIRFSVVHELAHLVLDCRSLAPAEEEQIAHRFAAAFLVPADAARRELGERRSRVARAELEMLKRKYGLSMQAWTRRARDLGIISEAHYREWQVSFRANATHVRESAQYEVEDRPRRLALLCIQAIAEGMIDARWIRERLPGVRPEDLGLPRERSEDEDAGALAELLKLPPRERRDVLVAQSKEAAGDYASSPEAREWIEFDDPAPGGEEAKA